VKRGDLVRRNDETEELIGFGVILRVEVLDYLSCEGRPETKDLVVLWPKHGIGWEYPDRLNVISEGANERE